MDWFRFYNGTTCDAKWLPIARAVGCAPGIVSNVWASLMEHANQQRPRGSIDGWDIETYVEFSGFAANVVASVYTQLEVKRLIVNGRLRAWAKRNGDKTDSTAAARQQRSRDRKKAAKGAGGVTESHAVTSSDDARHASSRSVTPQERESVALERYALASSSVASDISKSKSAEHARALTEEEIQQRLDSGSISVGTVRRAWHTSTTKRWAAQGVTAEQLKAAITLGHAKRKAAGSSQPLNIGFLDPILGDVIAGSVVGTVAARSVAGNSPPSEEDPLANAIAYARQLHRIDEDDTELARRIAEARAKFGGVPA